MFVYYDPNPRKRTNAGDCVIRAVAKVTGESWESVFVRLCLQGFMMGDVPSSNGVWDMYLYSKGFVRDVVPDSCPNCYTIADFARDNPKGKFIVATGSHAAAVIDGDIYDASDSSDDIVLYYYYMIEEEKRNTNV